MATLWLVIFVEVLENGYHMWHPLCICSHEEVAKHYIKHIENRFPRQMMTMMELPYFGP